MSEHIVYHLVPSTNRGRYTCDDPEHGHDLTSGEHVAILLAGQWIDGHIEHSSSYQGSGCYHIADMGRTACERPDKPTTPEEFERLMKARVRAAMQEGMSLADAMKSSTRQVVDLFCGYYFIASDGNVCGLCTGMKVRLR